MSIRTLVLVALVALFASQVKAQAFAGRWEAMSDDGTQIEVVELDIAGDDVRGVATTVERGYYSGRVTVKSRMRIAGVLRDGRVALRIGDGQGRTVEALGLLRGEYLVLRAGEQESGYARPGRPLVTSAEGSPEALALARSIVGRVYATGTQAAGRGAYVGSRTRVAFCADGGMAFDASEMASAPGLPGGGIDMGGTRTRRGEWTIVLRAGAPVVRATWRGTGSSYALTEYFDVRPAADGRSALIDGARLPAAGQCPSL
jgi:hypothetical protein